MEAYENMKSRTKIVLTLIGISAVLVPAVLLMFVSQNTRVAPQADDAPRQIDRPDAGDKKNPDPSSSPTLIPTPIIASPSPVQDGSEAAPEPR